MAFCYVWNFCNKNTWYIQKWLQTNKKKPSLFGRNIYVYEVDHQHFNAPLNGFQCIFYTIIPVQPVYFKLQSIIVLCIVILQDTSSIIIHNCLLRFKHNRWAIHCLFKCQRGCIEDTILLFERNGEQQECLYI